MPFPEGFKSEVLVVGAMRSQALLAPKSISWVSKHKVHPSSNCSSWADWLYAERWICTHKPNPSMGNQAGVTYPHPAVLAPRESMANRQTAEVVLFKNAATVPPTVQKLFPKSQKPRTMFLQTEPSQRDHSVLVSCCLILCSPGPCGIPDYILLFSQLPSVSCNFF